MKKLPFAQVLATFVFATMAWGAFLVPSAYATTNLYSQLVSSSVQIDDDTGITVQGLGNGLTGTIDQIAVKMSPMASTTYEGTVFVEAYIQPCPTNSLSTAGVCTANSSTFRYATTGFYPDMQGGVYILPFEAPTTTVDLDPTLYYFILLNNQDTHPSVNQLHLMGCSPSCYSGGSASHSAGVSLSPVSDIYFALSGQQTSYDTTYVSSLQPTSASTSASTNVHFSFSYHAAIANNIDQYQIGLSDASDGQTFIFTGTAGSGDATVTRDITLSSGHLYGWTVCMYSSSSQTSFGCANGGSFSVVTSFSVASQQDATSSPFYSPPIDDNTASSSLINLGGGLGIWKFFLQKFPFNWIYGFYDDVMTLGTGDTPYDLQPVTVTISDPHVAQLAYDQGFNATNTPITATITLFSTTTLKTVADISTIQDMRTLLRWILWFLFAESTFFGALSIFRKV